MQNILLQPTPQTLSSAHRIFLTKLYGSGIILMTSIAVIFPKGAMVKLVNQANTPFLDWLFQILTNLGDGLIIIPMVFLGLLISFRYSAVIFGVGLVHALICVLMKKVIFQGAPRPIKFFHDHSVLHFIEGVKVHSLNAFPSGHTATAFAFALIISIYSGNRFISLILFFLACLVGYSRMYLLHHFMEDVLAGAIVGIFSAIVVFKAFDKKHLPTWWQKRVKVQVRIE